MLVRLSACDACGCFVAPSSRKECVHVSSTFMHWYKSERTFSLKMLKVIKLICFNVYLTRCILRPEDNFPVLQQLVSILRHLRVSFPIRYDVPLHASILLQEPSFYSCPTLSHAPTDPTNYYSSSSF
jgi:hypothetical protein